MFVLKINRNIFREGRKVKKEKSKNFKNFISFWFCDVNSAIHIRLSFLFQLYRLHFFYKQLVYKQLALSLKIAKQLWVLNHLAISNNTKLQITDNRFEKDCLRVNQSLKIFIVKPMLSSNSPPPPSSERQNRDWVLYDLGNTVESDKHVHNS